MSNTTFAMAYVFTLTVLGARAIYVSKMVELRGKLTTSLGFNGQYYVLSPESTRHVVHAMFMRDPQMFVEAVEAVRAKGIAE